MKELLTNNEVAAMLKVKAQTLRSWRSAGHGPRFIRLGRGKRSPVAYEQEEIEKWIKQSTFQNMSEERAAKEAQP